MQTFLPYPDFKQSAESLDNARLGKQRAESKQVIKSLTVPGYGWSNHPAVKMWVGYERAAALYGMIVAVEWMKRGYSDTTLEFFNEHYYGPAGVRPGAAPAVMPPWLGDQAFHASHRANLCKKYPEWYAPRYGTHEFIPYLWPEVDPRDLSYSFRISAADAKRAAAGELTLPNLWEFDAKSRGVRVIVD